MSDIFTAHDADSTTLEFECEKMNYLSCTYAKEVHSLTNLHEHSLAGRLAVINQTRTKQQ